MAAIRFRFRNRPAISAREAKGVVALLKALDTSRAVKLADKILDRLGSKDTLIADLVLRRGEMLDLLTVLNEHAIEHHLVSDEMYRLRAELEAAINRT